MGELPRDTQPDSPRTPTLTQAERARRHAVHRAHHAVHSARTYEEAVGAVEGLPFAEVTRQLSHDHITTVVCAILSTDRPTPRDHWYRTLDSPTGQQLLELRGEGHAVHVRLNCQYDGEYTLHSWVHVDTPQAYDPEELDFSYEYELRGDPRLPNSPFEDYQTAHEVARNWEQSDDPSVTDVTIHVTKSR